MRIAQIHYTGFGGLSSVVESMVLAQGAERYDWAMGYYGVKSLAPAHAQFCNENSIAYAVFQPKPGNPWSAWRSLARWLANLRPNAIICHSVTAIPPCAWYARLKKIPLVAVEHMASSLKSRNEWMGSLASMLLADHVVIQDEGFAKEVKEGLGAFCRDSKIRIIPNGVRTELFYPRKIERAEQGPIRIGMASRFSSQKRQDLLIRAFERIADKIPSATLSLPGDGEELEAIRAIAAESAYGHRISVEGAMPQQAIPEWLRGIDIYVHATEGETLSMSILQAMATGLPIIASDAPGVRELIKRDSRHGLLVPNDDFSWSEAILTLAKAPELRRKLGLGGRRLCLTQYSAETMLGRYLELLQR